MWTDSLVWESTEDCSCVSNAIIPTTQAFVCGKMYVVDVGM